MVDGFDRAWRRVGLALDRLGLRSKIATARKARIKRYVYVDAPDKEKSEGGPGRTDSARQRKKRNNIASAWPARRKAARSRCSMRRE